MPAPWPTAKGCSLRRPRRLAEVPGLPSAATRGPLDETDEGEPAEDDEAEGGDAVGSALRMVAQLLDRVIAPKTERLSQRQKLEPALEGLAALGGAPGSECSATSTKRHFATRVLLKQALDAFPEYFVVAILQLVLKKGPAAARP